MAGHHRHRCIHGKSSHRHENDIRRRVRKDDQDTVWRHVTTSRQRREGTPVRNSPTAATNDLRLFFVQKAPCNVARGLPVRTQSPYSPRRAKSNSGGLGPSRQVLSCCRFRELGAERSDNPRMGLCSCSLRPLGCVSRENCIIVPIRMLAYSLEAWPPTPEDNYR